MTKHLSPYLPAMGIACSLGVGKDSVANSLFGPKTNIMPANKALFSGKSVPAFEIHEELPHLPKEFSSHNSLNNRLLKLVLDEILPRVEAIKNKYGAGRIGIILATNTSGMREAEAAYAHKIRTGAWPSDYTYDLQEPASPSEFAADYLGLEGPAHTISTACTSGAKALASATRLIEAGICDAVVSGGVDTLCALTLNGFDSLEVLAPEPCNPFSVNRSGITLGEGAAAFVLTKDRIEETPDIQLLGYGESSDAHHLSSPEPNGEGAEQAMRDALHMSDLEPHDIAYINLHGTASLLNDSMESRSTHRVFGDTVPCSSTKAMAGHTLGVAGAIEAAFLWLSLANTREGHIPVPPHIWDAHPDPDLKPLNFTKASDMVAPINGLFALMSNSFAFGGSNASLILGKKEV